MAHRHKLSILACAALLLGPAALRAQPRYTGPDPALAPVQTGRMAGNPLPSTVYRDAAGQPYVLRSAQERNYLSGYNVTWIDANHVLTPYGVGGFQ